MMKDEGANSSCGVVVVGLLVEERAEVRASHAPRDTKCD